MAGQIDELVDGRWYDVEFRKGRLQLKNRDHMSDEISLLVRRHEGIPGVVVAYPTLSDQRRQAESFQANKRDGEFWYVRIILDLGLGELNFTVKVKAALTLKS